MFCAYTRPRYQVSVYRTSGFSYDFGRVFLRRRVFLRVGQLLGVGAQPLVGYII